MNKNSFAKTPPMGWNSWDCYGAAVNEEQLLNNAAFMEKYLKSHGWQYVVCDIQWYEPKAHSNNYNNFTELCMDEYSRLIPAENRFPSAKNGAGFKPIADAIHSMGLKFGIHIMRGIPRQAVHANTPIKGSEATAREIAHGFSLCRWNTDMYGVDASKSGAQEYYNSLFELYAGWGVDFVKVDDICNTSFKPHDAYSAKAEIEMIRAAIDGCGRDMVLSLSPGPASLEVAEHLSANANMWRMTDDFWDDWSKLDAMFERCEKWYPFVGEGCWPDCDMLPLGKLCINAPCYGEQGRYCALTHAEQITMMTLWAIFRSPLMLGGELMSNNEFTQSLITNDEIIAVNQHSSGAKPVHTGDDYVIWQATAQDGDTLMAIFNRTNMSICDMLPLPTGTHIVRDVWKNEDLGAFKRGVNITVDAHGARLLKIR